jgi:hypothetical protein
MQGYCAWIAGSGDEGSGGAWLSAVMKEPVEPDKAEIDKLQQFVHGVLTQFTSSAWLRVEQPAKVKRIRKCAPAERSSSRGETMSWL